MSEKLLLGVLVLAAVSGPAARADGFVPDHCTVESWCLVKATDCFVGHFTHPAGLWKAHAQYSVVRRAVALCRDHYYGGLERRTITGPVEPIRFESTTVTTKEAAEKEAAELCAVYRKDWVDAAITCRQAR
ncbi:MAG: hypothetical protein HY075_06910 [Deltaproteobacteria bacterium]|nr:hypothetical protein [Deltaproteobacteria bacterium]